MSQSSFNQSLPKIVAEYPEPRWLFLTMTDPNCTVAHLGDTLTVMNADIQRLKDRKEFSGVLLWVRTT